MAKKILVLGSGAREHAMLYKIHEQHPEYNLFAAPGNPGIAQIAECYDIGDTYDKYGILGLAVRLGIDLIIVGGEKMLAEGIVDLFCQFNEREGKNLKIFGPTQMAARIETSKVIAKELMWRIGVPTAHGYVFPSFSSAQAHVIHNRPVSKPFVIKPNGLTGGKGVKIVHKISEAFPILRDIMHKEVNCAEEKQVIIEDFMEGEEASLFCITDGTDFVTLAPAQDHKGLYEGGPNTGGMGAYAPAPVMTSELIRETEDRIVRPVLAEMRRLGTPFQGCLYCGLMITSEGPKVVEFNCRFGDPETQVILPLLKTDFVELLEASCDGRVKDVVVKYYDGAAVCVVLASEGYPDAPKTNRLILGLNNPFFRDDTRVMIFHAGTAIYPQTGAIMTSGGRVLGVTAIDFRIKDAVYRAYGAISRIDFEGMYFRHDIAHRALARE